MNIYEKMLEVTKEVQNIEKNGENTFSHYNYVRAVDVIEGVQKALVKNKICLSITETDCLDSKEAKKDGGFNFFCKIKCKATFINAEKPEEKIEVEYFSEASDSLDKQIFKAKTGGLKYLLTQQFMLVTDALSDPEEEKTPTAPNKTIEKAKEVFKGKSVAHAETKTVCTGCGVEVASNVANYSQNLYKKVMCVPCQKAFDKEKSK